MESRTKNRKAIREIESLVAKAFPGSLIAEDGLTEFTAGWFNVTYGIRLTDGREVVLKIAPPPDVPVLSYERNIMATEVATMRLLAKNPAIPVPAVHFYDTSREVCDADYFFMEKVPGQLFSDIKDSMTADDRSRIERGMGEIVREINRYPGTFFGCPGVESLQGQSWAQTFTAIFEALLSDGQAVGAQLELSDDKLLNILARHLDALSEVTSPCLVHWDLWDANVLINDGVISGVIDFERALWAEPLIEGQFRDVTADEVTEAMRGYGKTEFTETETRRCDLYTLYLGLVMVIEGFYRAYETDNVKNIGEYLISQSLKRLT